MPGASTDYKIVALFLAIVFVTFAITFIAINWRKSVDIKAVLKNVLKRIRESKGWNYTESIIVHVPGSRSRAMIEGSIDLSNNRILSRIARIPENGTPQLLIFYRNGQDMYANIDGSWVKLGKREWSVEDTVLYRTVDALYRVGEFSAKNVQENGTEYLVITAETPGSGELGRIYTELYSMASPKKGPPQFTRAKITLKVRENSPVSLTIYFFNRDGAILETSYVVQAFDQGVNVTPPL